MQIVTVASIRQPSDCNNRRRACWYVRKTHPLGHTDVQIAKTTVGVNSCALGEVSVIDLAEWLGGHTLQWSFREDPKWKDMPMHRKRKHHALQHRGSPRYRLQKTGLLGRINKYR
jgi:hypothetical protein